MLRAVDDDLVLGRTESFLLDVLEACRVLDDLYTDFVLCLL